MTIYHCLTRRQELFGKQVQNTNLDKRHLNWPYTHLYIYMIIIPLKHICFVVVYIFIWWFLNSAVVVLFVWRRNKLELSPPLYISMCNNIILFVYICFIYSRAQRVSFLLVYGDVCNLQIANKIIMHTLAHMQLAHIIKTHFLSIEHFYATTIIRYAKYDLHINI